MKIFSTTALAAVISTLMAIEPVVAQEVEEEIGARDAVECDQEQDRSS